MTNPSAADVAALLGDWPARGSGSLAARLAFSLRSRILADLLSAGSALPPERLLADALAVSRSTLVSALDLLRSEGLVTSRQGSATRVTGPPGVGSGGPAGGEWAAADSGADSGIPGVIGGRGGRAGTTGRRTGTTGRPAGTTGRRAGASGQRSAMQPPTMAARLLGAAERGINFGISAPPAAAQLPALAVTSADLLAAVPAHGYEPAGLLVLRAALAGRHSAAGLPTTAEEIHVTNGAQHAIDLALATLCEPGDAVAVEDPTYPGVLDVIAARRLRPVPLAGDARGPTPAALEAAARHHGARVAFLLPAVHNPTGRVLDPGRRQALARTLDRLEMTVIEDNTLADLTYPDDPSPSDHDPVGREAGGTNPAGRDPAGPRGDGADGTGRDPAGPRGDGADGAGRDPAGPRGDGADGAGLDPEGRGGGERDPAAGSGHHGVGRPGGRSGPGRPASLAGLCRRALVVTVETTSKVAWGGLRVGWLRAPAAVVERSVGLRTSSDLGCSVPAQLLALQLLDHYDELIATRRPALRASAARFGALLAQAIPGCTFDPPAGGLSLWVRLPGGADAAAFASRALRHGVSVAPGLFASPTGGHDHLRLCHDRPAEELTEGIARLAAAWVEASPPQARPVALASHSRP